MNVYMVSIEENTQKLDKVLTTNKVLGVFSRFELAVGSIRKTYSKVGTIKNLKSNKDKTYVTVENVEIPIVITLTEVMDEVSHL